MKARWIAAAGAVLLGGSLAAWWWLPPEVAVVRPVRGAAIDAVYATGNVEPGVMLPLAPRVAGRLVQLAADEGDQVRKGQLLARLDDSDLRSGIDEQQARVDFARRQAGRVNELAARGFVAAGERDRTEAERQAAEAALARLQAQRGFTSVLAPADGIIIRRDGEAGQYLAAGQPLFVLACCAPLRVNAEVDEEDIGRVRIGQAVVMHADAVPGKVFDGRVAEITPKGDPVNRSYRVRIALDKPTGLRIGMTVDANLIVARRERALLLPSAAIRDEQVWVLSDGRLMRRYVATGSRGPQQTEVLLGLSEQDLVASAPDPSWTDGRRARPR